MITVTITLDDLVNAGACDDGIVLWQSIAYMSPRGPRGELQVCVQWTILHQVWLATIYPAYWCWLQAAPFVPRISLAGVDLAGMNLCGSYFAGEDLRGADFRGSDLRSSDMRRADLRGADFCGSDLSSSNLATARLDGADMHDADLWWTDLGEWERGPDGFACRKVQL